MAARHKNVPPGNKKTTLKYVHISTQISSIRLFWELWAKARCKNIYRAPKSGTPLPSLIHTSILHPILSSLAGSIRRRRWVYFVGLHCSNSVAETICCCDVRSACGTRVVIYALTFVLWIAVQKQQQISIEYKFSIQFQWWCSRLYLYIKNKNAYYMRLSYICVSE